MLRWMKEATIGTLAYLVAGTVLCVGGVFLGGAKVAEFLTQRVAPSLGNSLANTRYLPLKMIALFLLLVVLVGSPKNTLTNIVLGEFHYLHQNNHDKVFLVSSDTGRGTAFVVKARSDKSYLITNAHVCGDSDRLMVSVDKRKVPRRVLDIDHGKDLCLLENLPGNPEGLTVGYAYRGDKLAVLGHPRGRPLIISEGRVGARVQTYTAARQIKSKSACEKNKWVWKDIPDFFKMLGAKPFCLMPITAVRTTAVIQPGNSGSPVFDVNDNVIGVASMADSRTNRCLMIPEVEINKFLEIH